MSVTVMTWSVSRAKVAPSDIRRGCGLHRRALSKCPSPTLWARSSAIFYLLMCLSYLVMRLWWIPGGTGQGGWVTAGAWQTDGMKEHTWWVRSFLVHPCGALPHTAAHTHSQAIHFQRKHRQFTRPKKTFSCLLQKHLPIRKTWKRTRVLLVSHLLKSNRN